MCLSKRISVLLVSDAKSLLESFALMAFTFEIKHMTLARLEPLVDILLKYALDPIKFPLVFPPSADDLLEDSDIE